MAHYDSASNAPGASDDASGVATLLEDRPRAESRRPATGETMWIFFFSDGEELPLMGAAAFVEEHPWAKDVGPGAQL